MESVESVESVGKCGKVDRDRGLCDKVFHICAGALHQKPSQLSEGFMQSNSLLQTELTDLITSIQGSTAICSHQAPRHPSSLPPTAV